MAESDAPKPYFVKFDRIDIKLLDGCFSVSYYFAGEEIIRQHISACANIGGTISLFGFEGVVNINLTNN